MPMPTRLELDGDKPLNVQYAIPLWLRDEQIRVNSAAVAGRIAPAHDVKTERIAIVCYGPSLADTWEELRDFSVIMTCSGAHRFLLERGIVPSYHVEVDPRDHKIALVGPPHADVEYLIASTCHPSYFKHLEGFNVKLWHVFDATEDGRRMLPPGEWAITGGCGAGLRAMTLACFLGYREQHIFGMDGSEGKTGKHAAAHPNQAPGFSEFEYDGVVYRTTTAFLEAARQTAHELDEMPKVRATFHGDGLVQHMMRNYVRKPPSANAGTIAFSNPERISPAYRALNEQLHASNLAYGVGGGKHADTVLKLVGTLKPPVSVLDYGCGKSQLAKGLPFPIWEYDPAIPGKTESPKPADLVVCTDVLEHIEPDKLVIVLDDLRRVVRQVGYFVIHTGPAQKTLADGRNAHLIQKPAQWWHAQLEQFFTLGKMIQKGLELYVIVGPRGRQAVKPGKISVATGATVGVA